MTFILPAFPALYSLLFWHLPKSGCATPIIYHNVSCPSPLLPSSSTKFRGRHGQPLLATTRSQQWQKWKWTSVRQFLRNLPMQWGYRLSWLQFGLGSKLWPSLYGTRSSVFLYGSNHRQRRVEPCRSFYQTSHTLQGSKCHIQSSCLHIL
ncbi:hypothetical protein BJV78DRAFT_496402 [Lactifluus subvellereus]|nr:hypothetical protein BJV78DRAFT_496402 [Lactifluus subvellereus]